MTNNLNKTIKLTLLTLLTLSAPHGAGAQKLQASLSHYTAEEGLPSISISKLKKDDYGYIWLATWNGVSRFDGYNFYNYKTGISSGVPGLHNRVDDMVIDQAQNVWLKMYDGRLFVINRKNDRIENPLADVNGHEEFRIDYFFTPYVTSTGEVLVSFQDAGLYKFRLDRNGLSQQRIITGSLTVTCIVEGYHNDIWVGTNQGVHRVNMPNLSLERKGYFDDEYITHMTTNGYNIFVGTKSGKIMRFSYGQEPILVKDTGREVTGLYVDSRGQLWFSDLGDGACRLDPETGETKLYSQRLTMPEFTSRGAEFSEALGTVWVRMNHGGYGYYNRETDEVEYFHNDPSNPWNLSNTVNTSLEMNDGVVWESTIRRGLEKLEIQKKTIERRLLVPGAESPLENETRALYYDNRRGLLLIGNKKGTLFIYDKSGNRQTLTSDSNGQPFGRFYGISKDSKGNYWLCDKDYGVYRMTPNSGGGYTIVNYHHEEGNKNSLSSNSAYQTVEDKEGNIWIATYGGGVNVMVSDRRGGYQILNSSNGIKKYPRVTHQKVRTIALDKEGNVWAGTTDGILIMSKDEKGFSVSPAEPPEQAEKGLTSNDIVHIQCDHNGDMWIGTNSGGLSRSTTRDGHGAWQFENYGIADGLPSEEIHCMTFDNKGNLWFATDHIICSLDTKRKIITTFSSLDGVDDTIISEGAAIAMPNGTVLFGTMNGYYYIDRDRLITKTGSLLKLRVTDFFLNGELQSPRLNSTFDYYVPEAGQVELPDNDAQFGFRFAALNYQFQHRIHYQYQLEGYDDDWINASKTRMATYENVPGGTYKFKVKTFLLESPENYDIRTIEVIVPPHFLLSETAVWIYLALLASTAVLLLWRYQAKRRGPSGKTGGDKQAQPASEAKKAENTEEERTDEYEIIED